MWLNADKLCEPATAMLQLRHSTVEVAVICWLCVKLCGADTKGCLQNVDYGGLYVAGCANLNVHGPATLTYDTAALGFTQVSTTCSCRLKLV